jgi:hypothetical protein
MARRVGFTSFGMASLLVVSECTDQAATASLFARNRFGHARRQSGARGKSGPGIAVRALEIMSPYQNHVNWIKVAVSGYPPGRARNRCRTNSRSEIW